MITSFIINGIENNKQKQFEFVYDSDSRILSLKKYNFCSWNVDYLLTCFANPKIEHFCMYMGTTACVPINEIKPILLEVMQEQDNKLPDEI